MDVQIVGFLDCPKIYEKQIMDVQTVRKSKKIILVSAHSENLKIRTSDNLNLKIQNNAQL